MAIEDKRIVNASSVRRPARFRGALSSADFNDSQEEIITDIQDLSSAVNSLSSRLTRSINILNNDNAHLRRQVNALREQQSFQESSAAEYNIIASRFVDFSNTEGITFPNGIDDSKSIMVSAEFGEVTLPPNSVENKFYTTSLISNKVISPPIHLIVKGNFDKQDGSGVVNYEKGGKVYEGKPEYAFNGVNDLYWVRKVEFPLSSRVDEVECELTATVPEGSSSNANLLEILPYPNGSVDVTEVATASDLGNNFIRVEGFEPTDNLITRRYHFAPKGVDQVKIRLRQRNWIEENGKKVFYYGLQELGLKLIDYDKEYSPQAAPNNNNSFILAIPAVIGYQFRDLFRVTGKPDFLAEDFTKRHVHVRLCRSLDFSNDIIWDSDRDVVPQRTSNALAINSEVIYAFIQMNYVSETGGVASPYNVGTTPYLNGLGISFTCGKL
jgi:hypothetical protein